MQITIDDLRDDTVYEFKVSYSNDTGISSYSDPSHRAKTNKANPPEPPTVFTPTDILPVIRDAPEKGVVIFRATFERHGGAHISQYIIDVRNIDIDKEEQAAGISPDDSQAYHQVFFYRENHFASMKDLVFRVQDLLPGNTYQFRW